MRCARSSPRPQQQPSRWCGAALGQEGGAGACGLGQSPHPGCGPHTLVAVTLPLFRHRLGLIGSISPSCSLSLTVPAFAPVGSCSSARGSGAGVWCGLGTCGGPRLISIGFLCLVPRSKQACVCSLGVGSVPYMWHEPPNPQGGSLIL